MLSERLLKIRRIGERIERMLQETQEAPCTLVMTSATPLRGCKALIHTKDFRILSSEIMGLGRLARLEGIKYTHSIGHHHSPPPKHPLLLPTTTVAALASTADDRQDGSSAC